MSDDAAADERSVDPTHSKALWGCCHPRNSILLPPEKFWRLVDQSCGVGGRGRVGWTRAGNTRRALPFSAPLSQCITQNLDAEGTCRKHGTKHALLDPKACARIRAEHSTGMWHACETFCKMSNGPGGGSGATDRCSASSVKEGRVSKMDGRDGVLAGCG